MVKMNKVLSFSHVLYVHIYQMTRSENELFDFELIGAGFDTTAMWSVAALWYVMMCERSG